MRLLVTGDRNWSDLILIYNVLSGYQKQYGADLVVIHGAADGADNGADWACKELGIEFDSNPAEWWRTNPKNGEKYFFKGAGPERNILMLNKHPEIVVGFHDDILQSRGTRHCITHALKRGLPVDLFMHDQEHYAQTGNYVGNRVVTFRPPYGQRPDQLLLQQFS